MNTYVCAIYTKDITSSILSDWRLAVGQLYLGLLIRGERLKAVLAE